MTLRLDEVSARYGTAVALADVSFELATGERLAVLGPSGSGKSTLLRAIAGLEPLAGGRILWDGLDLAAVPAHRRGFGLMFQDYVLFPHRDVRGNVAFGLEMAGGGRSTHDARVAEVLDLVGLSGFERRQPADLSGGEQQRVALARALAPTPRLLMLDEPLGALDRALRTELLDELGAIFAALGLPIIYVTHDQEEALAIGDRVAVLRGGRMEALMAPTELWHSPPNEFVARFLGLSNIIDAQVRDSIATTAMGPFPVAATLSPGAHRLLIRPEGIRVYPDGPIEAIVESRTFRGDHTRLVVRPRAAGTPTLEVLHDGAGPPAVGESVRIAIDATAVVPLP